tara:strand:+ start:1073 stop:1375 length:303 start_codon:yes stop_codon:yes gene_type:complete
MNVPQLPNDIIIKILKHRKDIRYLDRKYEEQQMKKVYLLEEIKYQNEDLQTSLQIMLENNNFDEEEIDDLNNTPYSELLLENIENFNYYKKVCNFIVDDY